MVLITKVLTGIHIEYALIIQLEDISSCWGGYPSYLLMVVL